MIALWVVLAMAGPGETADVFGEAIGAGEKQAAKAVCTEGFWGAERDGGEGLLAQAKKKSFTLQRADLQVNGSRAVAVSDVISGGRTVDRVWLYIEEIDGSWLIDGLNEDGGHAALYVEGRAPARLAVASLPSTPELDALGAELIGGLELKGPDAASGARKVARLNEPKVTGTHWLADLRRGAIALEDSYGQKVWIFVEQRDDGWWYVAARYAYPSPADFFITLE